MKKIIPFVVVGILVLGGLGAGARNELKKSTEIVEVTGGIGQINVAIENTGEYTFDTLEWTVSVRGGVLDRIKMKDAGQITKFDIQTTKISKTGKFIFGLGQIDITINAEYAETWIGTAIVFGPFILNIEQA
jgi:hypothetical protein